MGSARLVDSGPASAHPVGRGGRPAVAVVGLVHESNTYSARATRLEDFRERLALGDDLLARFSETGTVMGGFLDTPAVDFVPVMTAAAWPGAAASAAVADALLDMLRSGLAASPAVDGVLLELHGSMVAEGRPDMDGDVAAIVRAAVGEVPIVGVLDLHANPSPALAQSVDALIAYDRYPHVDTRQRGREAGRLLLELIGGRRVRAHLGKLPLLTSPLMQATDAEPMRGLQERAARRARERGVARVSLTPGFPYVDVARCGFSILAVADEGREREARELIAEVRADVQAHAADFAPTASSPSEAVARARSSARPPVVLVDVADNVGGGSPGDGTTLLRELLAQGCRGAIVTLADARMARLAAERGEGALVEGRVGAAHDARHGEPVSLRARVERVGDGRYRSRGAHLTGHELSMGVTAVLAVDGLRVVVTERAVPPFHVEQLTSLGLDPRSARAITAKGAVAWRTAFGDLGGEVIVVDTPGVCPADPSVLPRTSTPMEL